MFENIYYNYLVEVSVDWWEISSRTWHPPPPLPHPPHNSYIEPIFIHDQVHLTQVKYNLKGELDTAYENKIIAFYRD